MKVIFIAVILSSVLLAALLSGTSGLGAASATSYSITKVQSGLLASDSLTTGNTTFMKTGGTATLHDLYEDSQGLHIGVQSPSSGQWVNYYAHPPRADAVLYHVLLTIPENSISDGVFNPGLYVEGSDYIPHVACEAYADSTGYYWDVEFSPDAGKTYTILYISKPSSMPHTQDCTIVTNGSNYLKVYIGGNLVYSNSAMSLGMSTPFITFVQDDTSSSSSMHYATFANYYATKGENIKVTNNPSNAATVKLLDQSGSVLASSPVVSGNATLDVGMYDFPLAAYIDVYDSNNAVIASGSAGIFGGDVYAVTSSSGSPTVPAPPNGLTAVSVSSSQIDLSWTPPSSNGGSAIIGYLIERSTDSGTTWSTVQSNTGSVSTTYSDTGLSASTSYSYRVSAINSVGTSPPSNTATAITQGVASTYSIILSKSGLVTSDSLINETQTQQQLKSTSKYWIYGGDAVNANDTYDYFRDTQGLHVGIQAPSNGTWAGLYALARNNNAMLFHSVLASPVQTIPSNGVYYEPGMFVQTNGSANVNYVTCASSTSSYGTTWAIFSATGNPFGATNFTRLWYDTTANQPLKRDCTMITNGNNYLKAYLDGKLVFESSNLNLQMPTPFMVFLEPQSSYSGQLLNETFTDYYATTGENVTLNGLPSSAARVDIDDGSGSVLATSPVSSGVAMLAIGQYRFPLSGTVNVYDTANNLISSSPENIYGGDVYSVTYSATSGTSAGGAISLTSIQSTSGTVSSSPYQLTLANVNAGTANNSLLVVGISANNDDASSVMFGSAQLTKAVASFNNNDAEFWYLKNPSGTGNIEVTMKGPTSVVVGAYLLSGVNTTNPIVTSAKNFNSSPSSPMISVSTMNAKDWVLDLPSIYGGKTLSSPTCSPRWDLDVPSGVTGASSSAVVPSPGSLACGWTASASDYWDDIAIEIRSLS